MHQCIILTEEESDNLFQKWCRDHPNWFVNRPGLPRYPTRFTFAPRAVRLQFEDFLFKHGGFMSRDHGKDLIKFFDNKYATLFLLN